MHVDSSVELGSDDPALEIPWASEDGSFCYCDIRNSPALIDSLPEAQHWLEMREFLIRVNVADFPMQTAKSDVWSTTEISPEEEIFSASWKFASYIDLLFSDHAPRFSLPAHQALMTKLCTLLQRVPDMPAAIEFFFDIATITFLVLWILPVILKRAESRTSYEALLLKKR